MAHKPLEQEYLQREEAEEIFNYLKAAYPKDCLAIARRNEFYGATDRPLNQAIYAEKEPSVIEHAAAQMMAFAENHSLNNANKRMGILAAYFVLRKNGYNIKRWKKLFRRLAPVLEKIIRFKGNHYNFSFLCLTLRFFIAEESLKPLSDYERRLKPPNPRNSNSKKRKREMRKRK